MIAGSVGMGLQTVQGLLAMKDTQLMATRRFIKCGLCARFGTVDLNKPRTARNRFLLRVQVEGPLIDRFSQDHSFPLQPVSQDLRLKF